MDLADTVDVPATPSSTLTCLWSWLAVALLRPDSLAQAVTGLEDERAPRRPPPLPDEPGDPSAACADITE